ncbi:hypothetical protein AG1IA_08283 [Rhizoctonia solani AG-1 IA]|uniref:Uncharacterized protein n=1 Tax=Thanatephorus cucumeris (strain AG1-IA) TaxID=983506 RepID=L8WMV4_THACA|nr:hypothetical protein AG1IA_08283 [Rhizoctonia solani AG-1 IA]
MQTSVYDNALQAKSETRAVYWDRDAGVRMYNSQLWVPETQRRPSNEAGKTASTNSQSDSENTPWQIA